MTSVTLCTAANAYMRRAGDRGLNSRCSTAICKRSWGVAKYPRKYVTSLYFDADENIWLFVHPELYTDMYSKPVLHHRSLEHGPKKDFKGNEDIGIRRNKIFRDTHGEGITGPRP